MKILIGSDHLGTHFVQELRDSYTGVEFSAAYTSEEQVTAIEGADVFMGWPTREVFLAADQLRWIHCPGMGIDRIVSTPEIIFSDIPVTNAPGPHVAPMANWVIGAMVALTHRFLDFFREQQAKAWDQYKYSEQISELSGRTMGLYGLGAIGRAVAHRAAAFGMNVIALDPHPADVPSTVSDLLPPEQIDEFVQMSDWLIVTAPSIKKTRLSINAGRISRMKRGSYIVVVSRGGIVDEGALCDAIQTGHLSGAALDATDPEPPSLDSRLWTLPNVLLTSHSSALTQELFDGRRNIFHQNLKRFLANEPLMYLVDKQAGY